MSGWELLFVRAMYVIILTIAISAAVRKFNGGKRDEE